MTPPTYAAGTEVSSEKSRGEIERTLVRYGASAFMYGWQPDGAVVGFVCDGWNLRFHMPLPDRQDTAFTLTPTQKWKRSPAEAEKAYEQAVKQRWRALALVIKAKLEAVEAGITTFQEEFAVHVVMPDGRTAGEHLIPAIRTAYETGQMPHLQIEGRR